MKATAALAFLTLATYCTHDCNADTFGSGNHSFDIEFITIGDEGNAADNTGSPNLAGRVDNNYRIGKYEVSEDMVDKANILGDLGIAKDTRGPDKPATSVNWFEAARFVNWLNMTTDGTPGYKFDGDGNFQLWESGDPGYNAKNRFRNSQARYFLPSADQWYKAAYYDPIGGLYYDYPTGSDMAPTAVAGGTAGGTAVYSGQAGPADVTLTGGASPFGTVGQGGNVFEWEETEHDLVNDSSSSARGVRGGDWLFNSLNLQSSFRGSNLPTVETSYIGFRVASIPTPAGDFDEDFDVDGKDFLTWQRGESSNPFDASELTEWEANFGTTATLAATASIPEPGTQHLAALLLAVVLSVRIR